ncbi:hypothetical protein [Legionella micdadei]|uniref:SdhA, substrate of the Dot/Icm system n=1 Tax=Legionella micdadei TaxID=451 RepID=A0A098GDU2_LEGMI|nr:hypothetical protein [Legionella micdadei]ARG96442.1 hypothetical protein B6N58_01385 [Legionella micdadei]ARG99192.1 hypothetical protein B6V88_01375 [Legionella micdadei]KTD29466.1 SdhA, substrate of the Dot/Icm system [Legionella micdadei]NSL18136.1 hypothetical protein [Legionella micdadei]CEG59651.1 protein of unknown function [Legionella micdadei]
MLEYYLKLLDSFKERQTSKLLRSIRQQILAKIRSPYFSPEIQPYFKNINKFGEPFTQFETEPKQVTQIKEAINGIYHAELAFRDLETVNLRNKSNWLADFHKLWFHTVKHGYHASYVLTHLGIDLTNIFSDEIKQAISLLRRFTDFSNQHADDAAAFAAKLKEYPISYNAGLLAGIAVDQMSAGSGKVDYHFLTQFSAVLPGYIQQMANYIQQYSPELTSVKPTLDQKKLDKLRNESYKLLFSLESLQKDNDFFLPAKVVYYVDILRHVIYLSQSTLEQMKNLDESSQEVIRNNLAELKYKWLVPLFGLVDRIEDEALLAPGTLSQPLMVQLKPFYQLLIHYTSNVVKFSQKGRELVTIEDDKFIDLRLEATRQRVNKAKRRLVELEEAQKAFKIFFTILEKPKYKNHALIGLPKPTKTALAKYYKYLQPYVKQLDRDLNNDIIRALTEESKWLGSIHPRHWLPHSYEKIKIAKLLELKEKIKTNLTGDQATQSFHVKLNEDIIKSIQDRSELHLIPYESEGNQFSASEYEALSAKVDLQDALQFAVDPMGNSQLVNLEDLDSNQAFILHEYYAEKIDKLEKAQKAYEDFFEEIRLHHPNLLVEIDDEIKMKLYRLYRVFHSYSVDSLTHNLGLPNRDAEIIEVLANGAEISEKAASLSTHHFMRRNRYLQAYFTDTLVSWRNRAELLQTLAHTKLKQAIESSCLVPDTTPVERPDHVIKHREFSTAIGEFKNTLFKLTGLFNNAVRKELETTHSPTIFSESISPFPELKDRNQALAQAKQVAGIKRLLNCVYHLEKTCEELENLNEKSFQSFYVYHLVKAYNHVSDIIELATDLHQDPHFKLLADDLVSQAKRISHALVSGSEPYRKDPTSVTIPGNDKKVQYGSIWYSLNAFMLVPAHIATLLKQTDLTQNELSNITSHTKEIVLNIESVIESSDSYFKLFLKTPLMYRLFKELKYKLKQFSMLTHDSVMNHLEEINTNVFAQILLETDQWEDKVGLKPGQLSGPMKTLLDELYRGLLEPLGCISQKHIALLTNDKPLIERINETRKRRLEAKAEQESYRPNYLLMKQLVECIDSYENFTTPGFGPPQSADLIALAKRDLLDAFEKALPVLQKESALIASLSGEIRPSPGIDALLGPEIPVDPSPLQGKQPSIKEIETRQTNQEHYAKLKTLMKRIENYNRLNNPGFGPLPSPFILEISKQSIISAFEEVIPIFSQHKALIDSLSGEVEPSPYIDKVLAPCIMKASSQEGGSDQRLVQIMEPTHILAQCQLVYDYYHDLVKSPSNEKSAERKRSNVAAQCRLVFGYYKGLIKTCKLKEKTAEEKESYLITLKNQQAIMKEKITVDYINKTFKKQVDSALIRKINLHHMQEEYNKNLKNYLASWKPTILRIAKDSPDIEKFVRETVEGRVRAFDKEHYRRYTHLEEIMIGVKQFELYFDEADSSLKNHNSSFETSATLQRKRQIMTRLKNVAANPYLSTEARIEEMRTLITSRFQVNRKLYTFEEVMLDHVRPHPFTYAWLAQLVNSFLQFFGLSAKPACHSLYEQLNDRIINPPDQHRLNRYRIFNIVSPNRRYELPQPAITGNDPLPAEETPVAIPG